jgi:pimeloyl-ACP methyl ester carboxylesterase
VAVPQPALHPVLWISPDTDPATRATGRFAERIAGFADVRLRELEVWSLPVALPYDLEVEVAALRRAADDAGFERFHLFGFSAGATAAIAAAVAHPRRVLSLAVYEPATIGDDDWDPVEAVWRRTLAEVLALAPEQAVPAFRAALMQPGLEPPPSRSAAPSWDERDRRLEAMIAASGMVSTDLAAVHAPVLTMFGGLSHPRFRAVAERMAAVMPHATVREFPDRSHFSPPHRDAPAELEAVLRLFWGT